MSTAAFRTTNTQYTSIYYDEVLKEMTGSFDFPTVWIDNTVKYRRYFLLSTQLFSDETVLTLKSMQLAAYYVYAKCKRKKKAMANSYWRYTAEIPTSILY